MRHHAVIAGAGNYNALIQPAPCSRANLKRKFGDERNSLLQSPGGVCAEASCAADIARQTAVLDCWDWSPSAAQLSISVLNTAQSVFFGCSTLSKRRWGCVHTICHAQTCHVTNDVPQSKSTFLMSDACAMQANQTVNCWKSCSGMRVLLIGYPPFCSLCQVRFQACSLFWCNHHHQRAWVMIRAQQQVHFPIQGYRIGHCKCGGSRVVSM